MRINRTFTSVANQDDANNRVASYESLLDLFTLLSFILIIAAVIFVSQKVVSSESSLAVSVSNANHGTGVSQPLPKDEFLIILYRENAADKLFMIDGAGATSTNLVVTTDVSLILPNFEGALFRNRAINLVSLDKGGVEVNKAVYYSVLMWLADKNKGRSRIIVTRANED